jgi:hypothetical protein
MTDLNSTITDFAREAAIDAGIAFAELRANGTLSASRTINFVERVPGEDAAVSIGHPNPFSRDPQASVVILALDGTVLRGDGRGGGGGSRYLPVLRAHDDITTVSHIHTPYLSSYAQAHGEFPFFYVPVRRWTRAEKLPVYIDRRGGEAAFILKVLAQDAWTPGIVEANGGSTVWGKKGILALASYVTLLEEGARFQIQAQALGGSQPFGPGVLEAQWRMSGLIRPDDVFDRDVPAIAAE